MTHTTTHDPVVPRWKRLVAGVRRLAFWGSILLPLAYVPLLSGSGVLSGTLDSGEVLAVAGLVALNVLCLLIGHGYDPNHER